MSSRFVWKKKILHQEWIFLRNRRPKLVKLGHFKSISKNCRNFKFFWPISIQNSTQLIFWFIKKIVSPLLLPLPTFFPLKITCFYSISKNSQKLKFFWLISLQNSTQGIFNLIEKVVSPLLFPLLWKLPVSTRKLKFFGSFPFDIQCKEFSIWLKKLSARSFFGSWRFYLFLLY